MVGFASPPVTAAVPPGLATSPENPLRSTMLGVGSPVATEAVPAPFPSAPPLPVSGSRTGRLNQTIIGMAPPNLTGSTPEPASPAPLDFRARPPSSTGAPPPEQPARVPNQKTIIGLARPGIAPLNPGQAKATPALSLAGSAATVGSPVRPPNDEAAARPAPSPENVAARPGKHGIPVLAAIAMIAAAALFAAAAVVWLFYHGHGLIEARARALADGNEALDLTCSACQDGSTVKLDATSATFKASHATLTLSRALQVGNNPVTLVLVNPRGKQTFVDISVPLVFRVRGDTTGLDATPPVLRVLVSAVPGSIVTVDSKPVRLNAAGEGAYSVDVSALVTGVEAAVKPLERRIPYAVTTPTGTTQDGSVTIQTGITPLVIDAPGASVVLDGSNFVLAGHTAKDGALTVAGRPITVDPTGRFAQTMNVSAVGETTIVLRASSKANAPRLFPLRVRRVESLAREAERRRPNALSSYATLSEQTEAKRGWAVALDGSVVELRSENYSTVIVMDVAGGCARSPCLARIDYGAPSTLARGDKFSAFGSIEGLVDGPRTGTQIPEIHADFLLKAKK